MEAPVSTNAWKFKLKCYIKSNSLIAWNGAWIPSSDRPCLLNTERPPPISLSSASQSLEFFTDRGGEDFTAKIFGQMRPSKHGIINYAFGNFDIIVVPNIRNIYLCIIKKYIHRFRDRRHPTLGHSPKRLRHARQHLNPFTSLVCTKHSFKLDCFELPNRCTSFSETKLN